MDSKFLDGVDMKQLYEFVKDDGGDGHTIWQPETFTKMGFKADDLPCQKLESGEGKHQIFDKDNKPIPSLTGVWGLTFMRRLADALGVKYASYMGRGFQARAIQSAVLPVLEKASKWKNPKPSGSTQSESPE